VLCVMCSGSEDSGTTGSAATALTSLFIEILDTPSFIQAESYRSCMHLAHHLHEQMLRYIDVGECLFSYCDVHEYGAIAGLSCVLHYEI
jgi:hypothetical protein